MSGSCYWIFFPISKFVLVDHQSSSKNASWFICSAWSSGLSTTVELDVLLVWLLSSWLLTWPVGIMIAIVLAEPSCMLLLPDEPDWRPPWSPKAELTGQAAAVISSCWSQSLVLPVRGVIQLSCLSNWTGRLSACHPGTSLLELILALRVW